MLSRRVVTAREWGNPSQRGGAGVDPLAALDDIFAGSSLDAKWTIEDSTPASYDSGGSSVSRGEYFQNILAGGTGGSFWFDPNDGILVYQEVTGPFEARFRARMRNLADSGPPDLALGAAQFGGLAVHDPDRSALNYVHIVAGGNGSGVALVEWKSNDSDGVATDTSAFATVAAPNSEIFVDFRMIRRASNPQLIDLSFRDAQSGVRLLSNEIAFTSLITIDRTDNTSPSRSGNNAAANLAVPLPDTLRLGIMTYSNTAGHDVQTIGQEFRVRTTTA